MKSVRLPAYGMASGTIGPSIECGAILSLAGQFAQLARAHSLHP